MYVATPLPEDELKFIKELENIKVVFDVGARTDTDYFDIWPDAEFHLFEPNQDFFQQLKESVGNRPNVYLNNFGLGDVPKEMGYNDGRQAFIDGEEPRLFGNRSCHISTLDIYCAEKKIEKIDYLKIDTEGYDFKVLQGAERMLPNVTHLQYEYWYDKLEFHDMLERDFYMHYTGSRNVLCTRKDKKVWRFQGA